MVCYRTCRNVNMLNAFAALSLCTKNLRKFRICIAVELYYIFEKENEFLCVWIETVHNYA